eukprot:335867-Chlamydomonas_euryale.AAC.2
MQHARRHAPSPRQACAASACWSAGSASACSSRGCSGCNGWSSCAKCGGGCSSVAVAAAAAGPARAASKCPVFVTGAAVEPGATTCSKRHCHTLLCARLSADRWLGLSLCFALLCFAVLCCVELS